MCFSPNSVSPGSENADPYAQCPSCLGLFLHPHPEKQSNAVFDGPHAAVVQQALEIQRHDYFLKHLLRIEKQIGSSTENLRLMEIGCGSGFLLKTAISRGWQADALELSPELASLAGQLNPSSNITVANVLDHNSGNSNYDAVMALDVVEHVLDPELMLKNCQAMLKPSGLLLIQTPNTRGLRSRTQKARWDMRDSSQHINLFSDRGLEGLLEKTGFEVVMLRTVSGSGMEKGTAAVLASIKEWLLDQAKLGNALCVIAKSDLPK